MEKLKLVKLVASVVTTIATNKVVVEVIKTNTGPLTVYHKVMIVAGSYIISSMVTGAAVEHVDGIIDDSINMYQKIKNGINAKLNPTS